MGFRFHSWIVRANPMEMSERDVNDCLPHLRYLARQLSAYSAVTSNAPEVIRNAAIESSLLSLRIVDEFFSKANVQPDDFRAHQFDKSAHAEILDGNERIAINKYLAHLTTHRTTPKNWEPVLRGKVPRAEAEIANFLKRFDPA
jgi:hypothetical protein